MSGNNIHSSDEFLQILDREFRSDRIQGILSIDIDDLKYINKAASYESGNLLIQRLSDNLSSVDDGRIIGRVSGDRFVVFFPALESENQFSEIANNIVDTQRFLMDLDGIVIYHTVSIGASIKQINEELSMDELINYSKLALNRAKNDGKNQAVIFNSDSVYQYERIINIRGQLQKVIATGDMRYEYQPIVDINTGKTLGFEVLSRMNSPKYGAVAPLELIDIAEKHHLMVDFDRTTFQNTCCKLREMDKLGFTDIYLSVNASPEYFNLPSFGDEVLSMVQKHGINPHNFVIEMLENTIVKCPEETFNMVRRLKDMGIRIYMDDFGTGYSNLSRFADLKLSAIKLDKSLIDSLNGDGDNMLISKCIDIAKYYDMKIIAEGIEQEEQLAILKDMKCDYGQGYLFGKSMDFKSAMIRLKKDK